MFQLPSFFKIRLVALVIGFFILFWLIGFVKWCFAATYYTIDISNIQPDYTNYQYYSSWASPGFEFDKCTGIFKFRPNVYGYGAYWYGYQTTQPTYYIPSPPALHADTASRPPKFNLKITQHVDGVETIVRDELYKAYPNQLIFINSWNVEKVGDCGECSQATKDLLNTACGGEANVEFWDDVNCTGYCYTCEEVEQMIAPCPAGQILDYQCTDDGTEQPKELIFPPDYPSGRYCIDCPALEAAWIAANCSGEGQTFLNYDCPTDTGNCDDCLANMADWVAFNCSQPGEQLVNYDCLTHEGDCNTCEEKKTAFGDANCVGPGLIVENYDCVSDTGFCSSCETKKEIFRQANCPAGQDVTNYNCEANTGQCEDCEAKRLAWANAHCPQGPGIELTSYDCTTDTGTCEDCYQKQKAWELSSCQGPGLYVESYDCPTNQGVCKDCGLEKQNYENAHCKPYGKILIAYDCAVQSGICGNDLCEEAKKAWTDAYCTGPGKTVASFNCDTKEGVCRDENSCESKEAAWETQHCKPLGLTLKSYDCASDTGQCNDPYGCEERKALWESKYCQGPGLTLESYDCVSDTGVCNDNSDCMVAENNWIAGYCSAENDVFISYDCATGHGQCQHGSDYSYTPTDAEKSLYTDRFEKFIDDMRHTPLFSLPDQVLGNIPSGGNPVYTVNMGQYGSSDVDLSRYSTVFSIVRTVFLVCFSFAALRILISHK